MTSGSVERSASMPWGTVLLAFLVTEVAMIASAFLWVFIYSVAIHSGGDDAFYQAYAQVASPVVAVVMAGPIFWAMGRFMRRLGERAWSVARAVVILNLVIDGAVVATMAQDVPYNVGMSVLAACGKVAGAYFGSGAGARR
jgi:hypothetical protein